MIMDTAVAVAGASDSATTAQQKQRSNPSPLSSSVAASSNSSSSEDNKKSEAASAVSVAADEGAKTTTSAVAILQATTIPSYAAVKTAISTHTLVHVGGGDNSAASTATSQFINRITTATVPFNAATSSNSANAQKLTISSSSAPVFAASNGGPGAGSAANFASMAPSAINNIVKTLINSSSTTSSASPSPASASAPTSTSSSRDLSAGSNGSKLINNHPLVATLMNAPTTSGSNVSSAATVSSTPNLPTITKLSAPNAANSAQKIVLTTTTTTPSNAATSRFLPSSAAQLATAATISPLMPVALNNISVVNDTTASTLSGSTASAIPIALNSNIKAIPINLKAPPPASNIQAATATSNTVSGLNIVHKSISPLPFMNENVTATASSTNTTKINTTTVRNLPTTVAQGASISTGSSAQPTSNQTLSSYIKSTTAPNTTATGFHHPGGTSIHKMTAAALAQPSTTAHTIAQICSGMGSGPGNTSSSGGMPTVAQTNAILSAIQPIRFLPNPSSHSTPALSNSAGITTSTITLTNPVAMTTAQQQPLNAVNVLNSATSSLINHVNMPTAAAAVISHSSTSTSSPSSSPMKPNIIRKPKRDSPAPSTLNDSYQLTSSALQIKDIKPPKFEISTAEKPYEQISLAASSLGGGGGFKPAGVLNATTTVKELSMMDHNKNLRKIMLTNSSSAPASAYHVQTTNISPPQLHHQQQFHPAQTTVSLAGSSSAGGLNSVLLQQTVVPSFASSAQQFALSHSHGANSTGFDSSSSPASMSNSSSSSSSSGDALTAVSSSNSSSASRKRRKQEIKKQGEETAVSYNTNPLSNNNALAYANAASMARPPPSASTAVGSGESTKLQRPVVFHETNGTVAPPPSNTKYLDEDDDAIYDSDEEVSTSASNAAKHPPSKIPRLCPPPTTTQTSLPLSIKSEKNEDIEMQQQQQQSSEDEACLDDEEVQRLSKNFRYMSSNGLSWSAKKCKPAAILNKVYKTNWKARNYHYLRYSDIKAKDLPVVNTPNTISQRELTDNLNEWKFHYVISQVNNLINYENESLQLIQDIQDLVDASTKICNYSDLYGKISESVKANSQRHRFVNEQLDEVHILIRKLFEHKEKFKNVLLVSAASKSNSSSSSSSSSTITSTSTPHSGPKTHSGQSSGKSKAGGKLSSSSSTTAAVVPQVLRKNLRNNKNINTRSSNPHSKSTTTTAAVSSNNSTSAGSSKSASSKYS